MRELGGFFRRHAVDLGDLDELRTARAVLIESVDPLAEAQVVFADRLGSDKDVVAGLFEIFSRDAEEAEAFRGEFEQAVGLDFRAGELDRAAVVEIAGSALRAAAFVAVALLLRGMLAVLGWWRALLFLALAGAAFAFVAAAFAAAFAGALLSLGVALLEIPLWSVLRRACAWFLITWWTGRRGAFTRFWWWGRLWKWRGNLGGGGA
jgi:hypothetical protein